METGKNTALLRDFLSERILVLDGAMGTMLQQCSLTAADFGGEDLEGCNENLVFTRPDVILEVHRAYFAAGADMVETNSFGSTPLVLDEYGLGARAREFNTRAAQLARQAASEFSTTQKPRFVAGSIGPTTKAISVTGGVTFVQLVDNFLEQTLGLLEGEVDVLLVETAQDTRNIKASLIGIDKAFAIFGKTVPVMVSGTIEPMGTMLGGQAADALVLSLAHRDLFSMGLNCATGPELMTDHLRTIHELSPWAVSCYPNAGLPDEEGKYLETPESLARQLERFVDKGWLNLIGGCCGTTQHHIAAIADMVSGKKPRRISGHEKGRSFYSGIEVVEATDQNRPLIVGERTNVIGSRLFKEMIADEKWDEATDIARRQVRNGAHIIDVCLQSTDREELPDIDPFYGQLIRKIKAPIMVDTTDSAAIEKALTYCQGKSIINSVNLEDGLEKFEKIVPLVKQYGAALVVGCIDEHPQQAQAFTRERKLEVALRSYSILTGPFGMRGEDLIFDPLVFPVATGDENYLGGGVETIEGLRLIKKTLPEVKTTLGISNVSFGLPPSAREVINSVFLYHCTQAGLDLAIVNAEKLERFAGIPAIEKKMAEDLLFNRPLDPSQPPDWREQTLEQRVAINKKHIETIAGFYRGKKTVFKKTQTDRPLDERLAHYVLEGSKDGLISDLEIKRQEGCSPLEIINGPLMAGMAEVGRLFNANELIVAEVLQSAEVMKAAVAHLEKFMEKGEVAQKGKVLLATVKGDVHDIGKNLVEIILGNNGYTVVNLGIKVPSETIIQAVRQHQPDIVGLSGLLVKSAQQMVLTAGDLREAGIDVPVLVGGAALSNKFTRLKIAPEYAGLVLYAKDAMTGLDWANRIMDRALRDTLAQELAEQDTKLAGATLRAAPEVPESVERSSQVSLGVDIPQIPYPELRQRSVPQLEEIWEYINPQMLYAQHLGFKGAFEKALLSRDPKALDLVERVNLVKEELKTFMKVKAQWRFFEVEGGNNRILFFEPGTTRLLHTFSFGRQPKKDGLCLADYVLPATNGRRDQVALFVVGAGEGIRERAEQAKEKGDYLKSHVYQAVALETAEATAEWLHRRLREDWGFPDPQSLSMKERLSGHYRGKRYSFGYPACPRLEDQEGIWKLLDPEKIGVLLTEGFMMEPEASVSALVFHHPDCKYFSV